MNEIEELSLLVYASRGTQETLVDLLSWYTGCKKEIYTDSNLIEILQNAIQDISRKYHIKDLFGTYCREKSFYLGYYKLCNKSYDDSAEVDVLCATLSFIKPNIFDEEDRKKIEELGNKFFSELKED